MNEWMNMIVRGEWNWTTALQQAKNIKLMRQQFSLTVLCVCVCVCVCTARYVTTSELSVRSSLSFLLGMSMPELCIDPWSISWVWEKSCISLSVTWQTHTHAGNLCCLSYTSMITDLNPIETVAFGDNSLRLMLMNVHALHLSMITALQLHN